ncbi:MAG: hypothetical protein ACYC0T_16920 [Ramlibacter sp.]
MTGFVALAKAARMRLPLTHSSQLGPNPSYETSRRMDIGTSPSVVSSTILGKRAASPGISAQYGP